MLIVTRTEVGRRLKLIFLFAANPAFISRLLHDLLRQLSGYRIVVRELHVE